MSDFAPKKPTTAFILASLDVKSLYHKQAFPNCSPTQLHMCFPSVTNGYLVAVKTNLQILTVLGKGVGQLSAVAFIRTMSYAVV